MDTPNTVIIVKNTETLDEYQVKVQINPDYLQTIEKWVNKRKYKIDETLNDLRIEIGSLFDISLPRSPKSDAELIREELNELKKEKQLLLRESKLFMHYYFEYWDEKMRKNVTSKDYLVEAIVESA